MLLAISKAKFQLEPGSVIIQYLMELSFVELSVIIGLLLKEKKVSLCVNHTFISEKGIGFVQNADIQ